MKLSIVVPAYNEEDRIRPMLESYASHFSARYGNQMEIVVVVNGSNDGTERVVEQVAAQWPHVRLVVEPRPVGKGGAVILGFTVSQGDLIGFVDADGSTPPEAFQDLVDHIGDAGAIIGSRWRKDSQVSPPQPLSRRTASRIFNALVRALFKLKISDTQCGAKLFTREAVQRVLPYLGLTHWAFDVDLLFHLRRQGFRIVERATVWHNKTGSKVNVPRASSEMLLAVIRLRLLHSPFRWVVVLYGKTLGRITHAGGAWFPDRRVP